MTRITTVLFVVSVAVGGPPLLSAPLLQGPGGRGLPPRDARQEEPAGSAVIRGRIVAADTGAPIRRAQVRASSPTTRGSRLASTDGEGRFEFRDLTAGRWEISASKAGFVTLRLGQRRPFEAGRPVELRDAEVLQGADIALPRGAAITGRVFDEFGDPVAGARVQVLRYRVVQGARSLAPTGGGDQSDDTGAFRLFGLTPGEYYVSATLRALPVDDPSPDAAGYAPTYFPGTGNVAEAQRVSVAVGQEYANVSFALLPVRTVRVTGTVTDSTGRPFAGGFVALASAEPTGDAPLLGGGGPVRPDGSFVLTNVAPGAYALTVSSRGFGRRGAGSGDPGEIAMLPLSVGDQDLTGVQIVTSRGATLSGTVTAAAGSGATLSTGGMQITAQTVPPARGPGAAQARVESSGTFTLAGLLGPRVLQVNGVPRDWMLQAITMGGTDITDQLVEFAGSQEARDVRVTLTDRLTDVNGTVTTGAEPAGDYTVVVFPEDSALWAFPSRHVRSARPDQQGLFRITALPPDTRYLAVAVNYLEEGEGGDPVFLESVKDAATRFALGQGETKALALTLVER